MVKKPCLQWDTPVQYIKGVGPKLAEVLKKRSIYTVKDLIHWIPRTYQDNRVVESLGSVPVGQPVIVKSCVYQKSIIPLRGRKNLYEILISDSTAIISCKFFRLPYKQWFNSLRVGDSVEVRGTASLYQGRLEFHHPQIFPANSKGGISATGSFAACLYGNGVFISKQNPSDYDAFIKRYKTL